MRTLTAHRDGIDLAIERFDSSGEPLLLIHGIGAEMLYWHDDFCHALVHRGFDVTRFDNRDSGESTHLAALGAPSSRKVRRDPGVAPYRLEDMADDAAAVLDALGWPSAHVVGHSLGGMIAQILAYRHADRVRSLTTISSSVSASVGNMKPTTILRLLRANPSDFLGRLPADPTEAGERLIRGHRVLGSTRYPLDEEWLKTIAAIRHSRGYDPGARARQAAAGYATGDIRPAVAAIRVPTLVVHGDEDLLVRPEGGIATAAAIRDAELLLLEGMGHDLPRDLWPLVIQRIGAIAGLP